MGNRQGAPAKQNQPDQTTSTAKPLEPHLKKCIRNLRLGIGATPEESIDFYVRFNKSTVTKGSWDGLFTREQMRDIILRLMNNMPQVCLLNPVYDPRVDVTDDANKWFKKHYEMADNNYEIANPLSEEERKWQNFVRWENIVRNWASASSETRSSFVKGVVSKLDELSTEHLFFVIKTMLPRIVRRRRDDFLENLDDGQAFRNYNAKTVKRICALPNLSGINARHLQFNGLDIIRKQQGSGMIYEVERMNGKGKFSTHAVVVVFNHTAMDPTNKSRLCAPGEVYLSSLCMTLENLYMLKFVLAFIIIDCFQLENVKRIKTYYSSAKENTTNSFVAHLFNTFGFVPNASDGFSYLTLQGSV